MRRWALCAMAAAAVLSSASSAAQSLSADEKVVARFNERGSQTLPRALSAERSAIKGLWEVRLEDGNSVFTDDRATHVIAGSLIELKASEDAPPREKAWARAAYLSVGDPDAARRAAVIIDVDACSEKCRRQALSLLSARQTRVHIVLASSGLRPIPESLLCAKDREKALRSWGLDEAAPSSRKRPCDVRNEEAQKIAARFSHQPKPMWIPLAGPAAREPGLDLAADPAGNAKREREKK